MKVVIYSLLGISSIVDRQSSQHTWAFNTDVMIWINANFFLLSRVRKLAAVERSQFMMALKVRPAPDSAVDDVRQALTMRNLPPPHTHCHDYILAH